MAITIMQGDSYPIFLDLKQDGRLLTPEMISDVEISVGDVLRFTKSEGTLAYDSSRKLWYFWPTQEETMAMEGIYDIQGRIKYPNTPAQVYGYKLDRIKVNETLSREVL
jgi:hypothetical protein